MSEWGETKSEVEEIENQNVKWFVRGDPCQDRARLHAF